MPIHFIEIDISKYKHNSCIISTDSQKISSKVTIKNNKSSFEKLLTSFYSLSNPEDLKIEFESTAPYALNLDSSLKKLSYPSWK